MSLSVDFVCYSCSGHIVPGMFFLLVVLWICYACFMSDLLVVFSWLAGTLASWSGFFCLIPSDLFLVSVLSFVHVYVVHIFFYVAYPLTIFLLVRSGYLYDIPGSVACIFFSSFSISFLSYCLFVLFLLPLRIRMIVLYVHTFSVFRVLLSISQQVVFLCPLFRYLR